MCCPVPPCASFSASCSVQSQGYNAFPGQRGELNDYCFYKFDTFGLLNALLKAGGKNSHYFNFLIDIYDGFSSLCLQELNYEF